MRGDRVRGRRSLATAFVAMMLFLAGCANLPLSGPVTPGLSAQDAQIVPDFSFLPNAPRVGSSPEEIVRDFIGAATSPSDGWAIARQFLAPDTEWDPAAGVTIDARPGRDYVVAEDEQTASVDLMLTARADVDATGSYRHAEGGAVTPLNYELARQPGGEWRITAAPPGIVIDETSFDSVYRSYSVMYFDPSWTFLVPDVRWFPVRVNAAPLLARALIEGRPTPWLANSVVSAFPEEVELLDLQVVSGGTARASLSSAAFDVDNETLNRMQRQLQESLRSANLIGVELVVDETVLQTEPAIVASTAIDPRPLVRTESGFGFLSGDDVLPIEGISPWVVEEDPISVALGRASVSAAVLLPDGTVARVTRDGTATLIDERPGLVPPAIDTTGAIWTAPRDAPGEMRVTSSDGEALPVVGAWGEATAISDLAVSRDGTRVAAIVTEGTHTWLVVSGIVRTEGRVLLSEAEHLAPLPGPGLSVDWLDETTLGALYLSGEDTRYLQQEVGGQGTSVPAAPTARTVAPGAAVASPRVLGEDEGLYVRRGATWQRTGSGVQMLGSQLGVG